MSFFQPHFGYVPDPAYTERYVNALRYPRLATSLPHLMRQRTQRDVLLWLALMAVKPSYRRGAQETGDCVGWGAEWVATALLAMQATTGESAWEEEASPLAVYSGCRVEVQGGRPAGYSPGAAGSWAAEWLNKYGVLLAIDYSAITGNPDHDLRAEKYSGARADDWGNYGCGGKSDKGALDAVAKKYPVQEVTQVKTPEEVAAAIDAGCPVSVASMVGYGDMQRNADGIVRRSGSWAHQMAIGGVKYTPNGEPLFRIIQSWGKSCSGPDPGIAHPAISDCSWWAVAEDVALMLRDDDSFAFSRVSGFHLPPWDFAANFFG